MNSIEYDKLIKMNTIERDKIIKRALMITLKIRDILYSEFDNETVMNILFNTVIYDEILTTVVKEWQFKDAEQNKDIIIEKAKEMK